MQQEVDVKQLRSFGLIVGGIFAFLALWPLVWRGEPPRYWMLALAALLIVLGLAWPRGLKHPYRAWMALGLVLGWINTRIILGFVFYTIITPMALIMRLRKRDPMRRTLDLEAETYRVVCQPRPRTHMLRQF